MLRARHAQVNYLSPSLSLSPAGLPSFVAQPPLPLQEFFPAQPLSLFLQPPLPLHEFLPLQSCVSPFFSSASVPGLLPMFDRPSVPALAALIVETAPPDIIPATA